MSILLHHRDGLTGRHDPWAFARDLLAFDPLYPAKQAERRSFAPAFEVKETEAQYVISADLPGVAESDVDISVENNVLTISGSRTAEDKKDGENYHVYERRFGSFTRRFSLPDEADADAVNASLKHGVLTVSVAKKAQAKPRKIPVSG